MYTEQKQFIFCLIIYQESNLPVMLLNRCVQLQQLAQDPEEERW